METFMKARKRLSVTSLMAVLSEYECGHYFEPQKGKLYNSFGYIDRGSVVFKTASETLCAGSGDVVFIPEGLKYCSIWTPDESIRFYSIHFGAGITDYPFWSKLTLQKIDCLSGKQGEELIKKVYDCCSYEDFSKQLEGYSLFYRLASLAVTGMKQASQGDMPENLKKAIAYIDANYGRIESVSEIAEHCFLSESRLYHLFRDCVNTTPVTYLNRVRILQATEMMKNPALSLEQIAASLNFNSEYSFRKTFRNVTGTTPSQFRKNRS